MIPPEYIFIHNRQLVPAPVISILFNMANNKKPQALIISIIFSFIMFFTLPQFLEAQSSQWSMILGTENGLMGLDQAGNRTTLWSGGEVKKIISRNLGTQTQWIILTSQGIFVSNDLRSWESRNQGLATYVIKNYEGGRTSLITSVRDIKDLEVDPQNPENMVCAIKDAVFLTRNGGRTWQSLGMPNYRSNGIKAVGVTTIGQELMVFMTHSIYGFYYIMPGRTGAAWEELNTGIENLETTNNPDEISDIAIRMLPTGEPEIIVSQTFRRRVYRLNWPQRRFELLWTGGTGFGIIDSLSVSGNTLRFIQDASLLEITIPARGIAETSSLRRRQDISSQIIINSRNNNVRPNSAAFPDQGRYSSLHELWLILPQLQRTREMGAGLEGLYLPINHALEPAQLNRHMEIIRNRNLNMIVIDMKDDLGRLRFTPNNPVITQWGRVFEPVNLESFLQRMKNAGVYTVARVVVFKDPEVYNKDRNRYAVWDRRNNAPWQGTTSTGLIGERWVDPYAEEFWEYIAVLSQELCQRGFDEIQYDYIRFPTDGLNLGDAQYRWHTQGMTMDSAIISFLRHVRQRIQSPISVCIYGANGWYRTGARTGQEVELLAQWVDIIAPMYYPSHFEQHFLAHPPADQRPYRIYYQGTLRNSFIARNRVIIRSWVQSFFLNVSYDREFYGPEYVRLQVQGTRDAGNGGLTYWNNIGRYDEIPWP